jgi:hypothetical protein
MRIVVREDEWLQYRAPRTEDRKHTHTHKLKERKSCPWEEL